MLLVLSAFSTRKPQSTFVNQYVLKKNILKSFQRGTDFQSGKIVDVVQEGNVHRKALFLLLKMPLTSVFAQRRWS